MSNQFLKLRRSSVPGKVPTTSSLEFGEIALNTYDGLAFIKKSGSNGEEIITIGATSGNFTGSLFGTASWAINAETSSYSLNIDGQQYYVAAFDSQNSLSSSTIYQSGSFIGFPNATQPYDLNNPDLLFISGSGVDTFNLISAHADRDGYVQLNVQNFSQANNASSDIVASANNATENSYYIDMGINGENYANNALVGFANDAYIYSTGNDLLIGNASAGRRIVIFNGGLEAEANAKVFIHENGTVGINTNVYNTVYPPSLFVKAIDSSTYNVVQLQGDTDNYSQLANANLNAGEAASADIVAYNNIDPISQSFGFVDMGINSTNYVYNGIYPGTAGDAYLFTDSHHLLLGATSQSADTKVTIFAGGISETDNAKLVLYGSNQHVMTGSLNASHGFTGSLFGTASWALNSLTSSFVQQAVSASYALTASYATSVSGTIANAVSASYADTASWAINALTASSANDLTIRGSLTGSDAFFTGTITAQTLHVQYVTASTEFITGSTKFGSDLTDTHQFTGSVSITGSLSVNGALNATSSWAENSVTSSYPIAVYGDTIYSTAPAAGPGFTNNNGIFLGLGAGSNANNSPFSNFIGAFAGYSASNANNSNFLGDSAGSFATNAESSNFFGVWAGYEAINADNSNFFGYYAGYSASNAYNSNFLGENAGYQATNANDSNFLGAGAGSQAINAYNSNFFGSGAGDNATNANQSNFLGYLAGFNAQLANNSNFLGYFAGYNSGEADNSNFLGNEAGYGSYYGEESNFLGLRAGKNAQIAAFSNFLGTEAGYGAINAAYSNFFGWKSGYESTDAGGSNFFGQYSGYSASNASNSNFIGPNSGMYARSASYSNLIGYRAGLNFLSRPGVGSNNTVIGTNITLADNYSNGINLGGLIFGSGSYSNTGGNPFSGSANGRIGINQPDPQYSLDVSGSGRYTNGIQVTGSLIAPNITGSLQGTASWAQNALTASFVTSSGVFGPYGSNSVLTASYSVTASWALDAALTASNAVTRTGSAFQLGGDLIKTTTIDGDAAGSFYPPYSASSVVPAISWLELVVEDPVTKKIYVGGYPGVVNTDTGVTGYGLCRLNSDLTLDNSFNIGTGTSGSSFGETRVIIIDKTISKIYVAGRFEIYSGSTVNHIVRLNEDGTVDTTFKTNGGVTGGSGVAGTKGVYDAVMDSSGKIVAVGNFTVYSGSTNNYLVRINQDGTQDSTFNNSTGFNASGTGAGIDRSGNIYIAGVFTTYKGVGANRIVGLNSDGTRNTTFNVGTGLNASPGQPAINMTPDDKVVVTGDSFTTYSGSSAVRIARINQNGTIDSSFKTGTGFSVTPGIGAIDSFNRIYVGNFGASAIGYTYSGSAVTGSIRLLSDGTIDRTFNRRGSGYNRSPYIMKRSVYVTGSNDYAIIGTPYSILGNIVTYNGVSGSIFKVYTDYFNINLSSSLINYDLDYSYLYTNRTLVDKQYVDNKFTGSFFTGSITFTGSLQVSGSIVVTGGSITGSLFGTSSWTQNAITASYILQATSASFASTASFVTLAQTASFIATASWANNSTTASFITASGVFGPFGSNSIASSSYALTASYATSVSGTIANAISASYAATASWAINSLTASSADNFVVRGDVTGSNALFTGTITAQRLNVQYITASTEFITGSTKFGTQLTDTHQFTGSVSITGSLTVNGLLNATSSWATNALTASYVLNAVSSSFASTASFVTLAQTASFVATSSWANNSVTASYVTASNVFGPFGSNSVVSSSYALTASFALNAGTSTAISNQITSGSVSASVNVNSASFQLVSASTQLLFVSNSGLITGQRMFLSASQNTISGSTLTVYGSGSAQPVFTVQGSQGELFSVNDSLSGSLFSVNDISGLPIIEAFSDNRVLIGSYQAPALFTTVRTTSTIGNNVIYQNLPTASYDGAFFDYTVKSGSNARAGQITAIWSGSSVNFTETTTTDFGDTSGVRFGVIITGSNMALTGSFPSASWTMKTIVRSI